MSVHHYTNSGRFNLMSDDKQQQVVLVTPVGTVSCLWPDGEAPYEEDMMPSEVSQILRARIKSYLFMSDRDKKLSVLDAIDAKAAEFDRAFYLGLATQYADKASHCAQMSRTYRDRAEDVE